MFVDSPYSIIAIVVGAIVLPLGLIATALYNSVLSMSRKNLRLRPVGPEQCRDYYRVVGQHHAFAKSEGFEWVGGYLISAGNTMFVAAWEHHELPTYFCVYCHGAVKHFDFVTSYSDEAGLTTASTKDAHIFPHRPGFFIESIPGKPPEELWAQHQRSVKFLKQNFGLVAQPRDMEFDDQLIRSIRGSMAYVRSHFAWPIRGVYWYLVVRFRKQGRTIEQQYGASA